MEVAELKTVARKIFDERNLDECHWHAFWVGYLAATLEFGCE